MGFLPGRHTQDPWNRKVDPKHSIVVWLSFREEERSSWRLTWQEVEEHRATEEGAMQEEIKELLNPLNVCSILRHSCVE